MTQGQLSIHTENILPIIKKWLYTEKEIFVRELVSNSCDALRKAQILNLSGDPLRVDISIDRDKKIITFADSGIGMTSDEVTRYIAQIAFSGAEEFVKTYEAKQEIIGHFGLGFYSAYMAAAVVEIDTLSYQEGAQAALWRCDGSSSYTLDQGTRTSRGTSITLHIAPDSEEFLEESLLRQLLLKYCRFLPFPIFLEGKQINEKEPLWLKPASSLSKEEYLSFYHELYPLEPDPVAWIHLNVDYPFNLKGILYLPKITKGFDWSKNQIQLYSNRVFVASECKDLLPDFLLSLQGAIDSPDIPLNVSRSTLQMDRTVRQLSGHISKKIADRFETLFKTERDSFEASWKDLEIVIKLGMLQDEKFFEKAKEFSIFKTVAGTFTSLATLEEKVLYTTDLDSPLLKLYPNKTIVISSSPVDTAWFSLLEDKTSHSFCRLDGEISSSEEVSESEKEMAKWFEGALENKELSVETKKLSSPDLPSLVLIDEKSRRFKEAYRFKDLGFPLPDKKKLVINAENGIVQAIYSMKDQEEELAKSVANYLAKLALLGQKELPPEDLTQFVSHSTELLQKLLAGNRC